MSGLIKLNLDHIFTYKLGLVNSMSLDEAKLGDHNPVVSILQFK